MGKEVPVMAAVGRMISDGRQREVGTRIIAILDINIVDGGGNAGIRDIPEGAG